MKGCRVVVLLMFSVLFMVAVPPRLSVSDEEAVMNISSGFPSMPHSANALWLEPPTIDLASVNVGERFSLAAWINVTDLAFTWQAELLFDPIYFNAMGAGYTNGSTSDFFSGLSTVPVSPVIDNAEGYVLFGESLLMKQDSKSGCGSLMWVEFELMQMPSGDNLAVDFSPEATDTFVLDSDMNDVILDTLDGTDIILPPIAHDVYLLLVGPEEAECAKGQSVFFGVEVFNQFDSYLESTLTLTVTGPNGYYRYDFQTITVEADSVGEYSFSWNVPDYAGIYVVEVGLVPPLLMAYDAVWLEVV